MELCSGRVFSYKEISCCTDYGRGLMVGGCEHSFAQAEALKQSIVPSIILDTPLLNLSGSTMSRAATASIVASAFSRKDIAASFFSAPDLLPLIVSVPLKCTTALSFAFVANAEFTYCADTG
jgi:hypothetical protein